MAAVIVWFRLDLRLEDNEAFQAAIKSGNEVIPVYIWAPEEEKPWAPGAASKWWLHYALEDLDRELGKRDLRLIIRSGLSVKRELAKLVEETKANTVYWNRCYEPAVIKRDTLIKKELTTRGVVVQSFKGNLLFEPWEIENKSKKPFKVFTPFWKHCLTHEFDTPIKTNYRGLAFPTAWPKSLKVSDLKLRPVIPWDKEFHVKWNPTLEGGKKCLADFVKSRMEDYKEQRDFPGVDGTSRLSPYLHFGQVTPRQVCEQIKTRSVSAKTYVSEIGWREFAYHLLYHFPHTPESPFRAEFAHFPWKEDSIGLKEWQDGLTGFPIVDAGMRQLWRVGWMHNRVRMIVASFLVKDQLISWEEGARWFWDTLVDADLASNTLGWQWAGGCGADAAPYFRVFNPMLQGAKFDPEGKYIREYIPELGKLPSKYIHAPWEAPKGVLIQAGVTLGENYPLPILDHKKAREKALHAYDKLKHFNAQR